MRYKSFGPILKTSHNGYNINDEDDDSSDDNNNNNTVPPLFQQNNQIFQK